MFWWKGLVLCFLIAKGFSFQFKQLPYEEILKILVPTLSSKNAKCRNHTQLYLEELKKMKLWATEMFDSSSKFPSGVLYGSTSDFGNFDECVGINVDLGEETLRGKYCMATFHISPPNSENHNQQLHPYYDDGYSANTSAWEKITAFSRDRSRSSRNDFRFSFCIPSSCTYDDLESTLKQTTESFNSFSDFKLSVSVNPRNCQLKNELSFTTSDIIFMFLVAFFVFICLASTTYDWLIKLDDVKKYKLEGKKHKVVICFSVWSNLKKLNKEQKSDEGLQCIHGLKVVSMFFIIMGHRIMFSVGSSILNPNFVESAYGKIEASVLLNGPIIVDTFFNISGFLVCYLLLKEFEKKKRNFFSLYIHRFIRLTPAYAIILAFYCTIFIKLGSGPFWLERVQVEQERCLASWWANIFYLNNYINKEQICMFQSWYLTCDMHFFIVAPIIIWLLRKKPYLGLAALFILLLLSVALVFTTVYFTQEDAILLLYIKFLKDPVVHSTFKNVYIPTHMRASPYFVGMITGYLKFVIRSKDYKMPKCMVYMGWVMSVLIIEVTVYSGFIFYIPGKPYDPLMSATYASVHHLTWSVCISWMIIAISEGNGAWIQPILSWKPFVLLSRITYTAFLCHGAVQIYTIGTSRHSSYASLFNLVYHSAADISLAYSIGLLLSMFFEAPILGLEKVFLREGAQKSNEDEKTSPVLTPKIKIISRF